MLTSLSLIPCNDLEQAKMNILNFIRVRTGTGRIDSHEVTPKEIKALTDLIAPAFEELLPQAPDEILQLLGHSDSSSEVG